MHKKNDFLMDDRLVHEIFLWINGESIRAEGQVRIIFNYSEKCMLLSDMTCAYSISSI